MWWWSPRLLSRDRRPQPLAAAITWHRRGFEPGDTAGAWLVHTATGNAAVDAAVTTECNADRIFCVNAAVAEDSSAWVPAVTRHDGLTVASFGGGDRAGQWRFAMPSPAFWSRDS